MSSFPYIVYYTDLPNAFEYQRRLFWCQKNCKGLYQWEISDDLILIFYFELESDAALFKLIVC
jgi:hypothetical protein